ncbi:MAG: hypothetical protein DPW16_06725 [Chloroflexi bacterium]|nr:hypothetical protein [Chloroflexota bacterium]
MRFLVCFCAILLILANQSPIAEGQSNAPFIYYYSPSQKAFVIERADGSENRILTNYAFPEEVVGEFWIIGPGWSPSGNWLAWTIERRLGGSTGGITPVSESYIVNRQSGDSISLIRRTDGIVNITSMDWSPMEDLLLVNEAFYPTLPDGKPDIEKREESAYIFDPSTQQITLDIPYGLKWSYDGSALVSNRIDSGNGILLVGLDGTIHERFAYIADNCDLTELKWSRDNKLIYKSDQENLIVEDFTSGGKTELELPEEIIRNIEWSYDNQYALIYTLSSCEDESPQLWIFSLAEKLLTVVLEQSQILEYLAYPAKIISPLSWSPTSNHAFAISQLGMLYLISTSPFEIKEITLKSQESIRNIKWAPVSNQLTIFVSAQDGDDAIYLYNIERDSLELLASVRDGSPFVLEWSPNENLLAFSDFSSEEAKILDVTSRQITNIKPLSNIPTMSLSVQTIKWDPTGEWLFLTGDNGYLNVTKSDGSHKRGLVVCILSPSCFGWLP